MSTKKIAPVPLRAGGSIAAVSRSVSEASNLSIKEKMRVHRDSSTLAKLKLADLQMHGRENEMYMLIGKLGNIDYLKDELVMVAGSSGCGKSSLVMKGLCDPAKKTGIAFCGGKFDLNNNAIPYSAFVDALSELAQHVVASKNASLIKSDIKEALGADDMQLIGQAMPGCQVLFPLQSAENKTTSQTRRSFVGDGKETVTRMQYAIRRLMKATCSNTRVVMFLDDLQWADAASLDLLLSLQTDKEISSLLLVGAYRDNEVLDGHPLAIRLREAEMLGSAITTILLGNLEPKTVQLLVAEALRMEDEKHTVDSLAAIIHKKTDGNPFFVVMFLTFIYEEELLKYNFGTLRWNWDDKAIKQKFVTDNVTSITLRKLERLNFAEQNIVKVASCLGASFSIKLLAIIVSTTNDSQRELPDSVTFTDDGDDKDGSSLNIYDIVEDFHVKGIWEHEIDDMCCFAHDQIQSAALDLIPKEEQTRLKGIIGGVLLKKLDEAMIDEAIFVIVSLRNHAGPSLNEEERFDLVKLNFRAGTKASDNAAFDTAAVYFQAARELLGSKGWEIDQELTIRLYSAEAQARFVIGDLEIMETLVEEILSKDIPVKDKFQAYETKILAALSSGNRSAEALYMTLYVRKLLGFNPIPTKVTKAKIIIEYLKTNRALKGLTTEDIMALPDLTDERIIMGQRMMELLLTVAYQTNPNLFPIISFRMVRETIKSGINRSSCDAFSTFGVLLCGGVGDFSRGAQMGKIAFLMLEKLGMRSMESRISLHVVASINHWTVPLQRSLASSLKGYHAGLASGDIQSAAYHLILRSTTLWYCSRPLDDVVYELNVNKDVCTVLKNAIAKLGIIPYLQAAMNLQGDSSEPWKLSGAEMVFEEADELCVKTKHHTSRAYLTMAQLELFVIFQKWGSANRLLVKVGDLRPVVIGLFQSVRYIFLESLICLKAAQASSSWIETRKLKSKGEKSLKKLRGWLKKGNINVVHMVHLLTAESAVLNGKHIQHAEGSYREALSACARSGFLQDKALTHELAGIYYMGNGDDYWARHNLNLAHTTYLDWKANTKAVDLAKEYPQFIIQD